MAPFVVVPGHHAMELAIHLLRERQVDDRGFRRAHQVPRHHRLMRHVQDAVQFTLRRLGEGRVDDVDRGPALELEDEIEQGDVWSGNAYGESLQPALELRQDADRGGDCAAVIRSVPAPGRQLPTILS